MKLPHKLLIGLSVIFALGFGATAYVAHQITQSLILERLNNEAKVIRGLLMATRGVYQKAFVEAELPLTDKTLNLLPAHALSRISESFPDWVDTGLSFNNVSIDARNPNNFADSNETLAIRYFENNPKEKERFVRITADDGREYYHLATPIRVEPRCLLCHGKREEAPATIRDRYVRGFGYKVGDVRGIISIKVPYDEVATEVSAKQIRDALAYGSVFALSLLFLGLFTRHLILERIERVQEAADRLTDGNYRDRIVDNAKDEIGLLTQAFNHMAEAVNERETALMQSQAAYRSVINSVREVIFRLDREGCFAFLSPVWTELTGYPVGKCIGRQHLDFIAPEDHDKALKYFDQIINREIDYCAHELRYVTADGGQLTLAVHGRLPPENASNPFEVTGTLLDITERREAEHALEASERKIATILESIKEVFISLDDQWRITYVNAHISSLGGDPEAVLDKEIWDEFPELASYFYRDCSRALRDKQPIAIEGFYPPLERWLECHAYPSEDGLTVYFLDITARVHAHEELEASEARTRLLFDSTSEAILSVNSEGIVTMVNQSGVDLLGYPGPRRIKGKHVARLLGDDEGYAGSDIATAARHGATMNQPLTLFDTADGIPIPVSFRTHPLLENSKYQGVVVTASDMTEQRQTQERLKLSASFFENASEGVMITDPKARITSVNKAFEHITGYSENEVLGESPSILKSGRQDETFYKNFWSTLKDKGEWNGEIWNRRKNGEIYPQWLNISVIYDDSGDATHFVAVFSDLSAIKRSERQIEHLAHYDPLTGLPNRLLFEARLDHALEVAKTQGSKLAVLFLDIDRFKDINDSFGHTVGDRLLVDTGRRVGEALSRDVTIARMGGDEFAVLFEAITGADDAAQLAGELVQVMAESFVIDDTEVFLSISVGISLYPEDAHNREDLIRYADVALYRAKDDGRNRYQFYTSQLTSAAFERVVLERSLRHALNNEEFELFYQPQVEATTGRLFGLEALIRWQHPDYGLVAPGKFIPLAEQTGLILDIGAWALLEACRQMAQWHADGCPSLIMAVNLSGRQIDRTGLLETVGDVLTTSGFNPAYLELEITESFIMQDPGDAIRVLSTLREAGVSLSVDDFGTGHSSLSYLRRLPIHSLKIDRSFVRDLPDDPDAVAIACAIIALGHSMQLRITAEGVETEAQRDFLIDAGCDILQGYLFSEPLPAEAMKAYMEKTICVKPE